MSKKRPQAECHPDKPHFARGMCKKCYDANYQEQNRCRATTNSKKWAKSNPDMVKNARLKYRYGIDLATYTAKLAAQDGLCKICQNAPAEHVDHCHLTGEVRGLLCGDCNRAIGLFREDRATLMRAVAYLELYHGTEESLQRALGAVQVIANTGRPVR